MVLNLISNSDHKEACQEINHDVFNLMTSLTYLNSDWTLQHKLNKEASKLLSTNGELKHKLFKTEPVRISV